MEKYYVVTTIKRTPGHVWGSSTSLTASLVQDTSTTVYECDSLEKVKHYMNTDLTKGLEDVKREISHRVIKGTELNVGTETIIEKETKVIEKETTKFTIKE